MSAVPVMPSEVRELLGRLPRWHGPFVNWSARFVNRGPSWLPFWLRKLPLHFGCAVAKLYVKGWL